MPQGPAGIIAIKPAHVPAWLPTRFDPGVIHAESGDDKEVKELRKLIQDGHAFVVQGCRFMHVASTATSALGMDENDSDEEDEDEEDGDDDVPSDPHPKRARNGD